MVEHISEDKNRILDYMGKSLEKYGPDKMNVEEIGKLADAVKDMAEAEKACWEAEYYRSVTEAMESGSYGYDGPWTNGNPSMGYNGPQNGSQGRMGYRDARGRYARRGYGYHEHMEDIRNELQGASPEEREKMKRELRQMLDM